MAIRPLGSISEYVSDILLNGGQIDSFNQTGNVDYDLSLNSSITDPTRSGTYNLNSNTGGGVNLFDTRPTGGVPVQVDVYIYNVDASASQDNLGSGYLNFDGTEVDTAGGPPYSLSATGSSVQRIGAGVNMIDNDEYQADFDITVEYQFQTDINVSGVTQS